MSAPTSTLRLQVRPEFDLYAAADACDLVATLGAGAVYLSPLLPSSRGSDHGYDVVGYDTVDAARGGIDGWTRLLAAARARGLKVIVDIVPNHTGVANAAENPAWWDLLMRGPRSRFARWFDVEWDPAAPGGGRINLPVLGDDFAPEQLVVDGEELAYHEHRFPIAPTTGPRPGETAADVHDRQHYRLINYRLADTEQNYRRFFAVTTLAGLCVEDPDVFDATHVQIARWMQSDGVDGLRVDHPDGLADPRGYLDRLATLAGDDAWIVVEKILDSGEEMPADWRTDGTTGYDALREVTNLIVDPAAEPAMDALYRQLTEDDLDAAGHVQIGKRDAVTSILRAEVARLARLMPGVADAHDAIAELLAAFPGYRSYLPHGLEHLQHAVQVAIQTRPDLAAAIELMVPRLQDPADELCVRFQQTSGPVQAKGVEDTVFYRYTRLITLNEVGGDPACFGKSVDDWHATQERRQRVAPRSMTTISTHDTKRSEDVRARIAVLAEVPDEWGALAESLMQAAPIPDPSFAYLLWQTFVGAGFIERERMHAYTEKAMREAGTATGWIDPNTKFEAAVHAIVDRAYDDPAMHHPLQAFIAWVTPYGWSNSLTQKLVQLTMPGVPDVYQGTARWDDSLVDPDNRRPVDTEGTRVMLDELDADVDPPPIDATGRAKLWVVSRALRLRRDWPELFTGYAAVRATGSAADHVVAFDRGGSITVATRLPVGLERAGGWRDTTLPDLGAVTDAISGRRFAGPITLADLLSTYPVALLVR